MDYALIPSLLIEIDSSVTNSSQIRIFFDLRSPSRGAAAEPGTDL